MKRYALPKAIIEIRDMLLYTVSRKRQTDAILETITTHAFTVSGLLPFTDSDYPFGIFKVVLHTLVFDLGDTSL
jgi:ribosomal protein S4E